MLEAENARVGSGGAALTDNSDFLRVCDTVSQTRPQAQYGQLDSQTAKKMKELTEVLIMIRNIQ